MTVGCKYLLSRALGTRILVAAPGGSYRDECLGETDGDTVLGLSFYPLPGRDGCGVYVGG